MRSELIRKESIEELCGHRARALELYARAAETLREAVEAHERSCYGSRGCSSYNHDMLRAYRIKDRARWETHVREVVDRDMWSSFVYGTPLGSLMDKQAREQFESDVRDKPPEATPENVEATLRALAADAETIFRRGLVNVFRRLCTDYRSHDGFKIGDRVILQYGVDVTRIPSGSGRQSRVSFMLAYGQEAELMDLDRVMHVLDGQPAPDWQTGLCAAIRSTVRDSGATECETPYFRARWFKNRALHLWFVRDDLVERANKLIAEHYGAAVGAGPDVAKQRR